MEKIELVNKWLEHCGEKKHTTAAEAMDRGQKVTAKHATYSLTLSGKRILCNAPRCQWSYPK